MCIASNADNFFEELLCSYSCIFIETFVFDEIGICHAGKYLSEESDGLLSEFLRIANVAEGDLIKRET